MAIQDSTSDVFYQRILSLARRKQIPLKAMFELTHRCNFNCVHCYVVKEKDKRELTTTEVKEILRQLKAQGCFHIGFTGGEPLIRGDIFEILKYAKLLGFRISLLTNGYFIDKSAAKEIASLGIGLNRVDISVLGAALKTFERITKKKGSFRKVIQAVKLLKDRRVNVQIKTTLMKPNQDELLEIKRMADSHKAMFRYSHILNPKTNGDRSPLRYQLEPLEVYRLKEKISLLSKVKETPVQERCNFKNIGRNELFRCGAGVSEVSISPYGEMKLCLEINHPRYDILKGSFKQGWQEIRKFIQNFKPTKEYKCDGCNLALFCDWCPGRGLLLSGSLCRCSQEDKELALAAAKHASGIAVKR